MEKISVAVRVRPPSCEESENAYPWKVKNNLVSLHGVDNTPIPRMSFAFDHVFDQDCSNGMVYEILIKNTIRAVVEGFNGTAFAYGQKRSGKTFTMMGTENDPGIIHRAVKDLFANIQQTSDRKFQVLVSYVQIYDEDIFDLLADEYKKLEIEKGYLRGIFAKGLKLEIVNNVEEVLGHITRGEALRSCDGMTEDARGSMSHTIFRMIIQSYRKDRYYCELPNLRRVSVLSLVDLAGHTDKGLTVLNHVVNKLIEGYERDYMETDKSKLTMIVQAALGGNAKTSIICTIAPEEAHVEDTTRTLEFASRAKQVTNCVKVNQISKLDWGIDHIFPPYQEEEEEEKEEEEYIDNQESHSGDEEGEEFVGDEEHYEQEYEYDSNPDYYEYDSDPDY